MTSPPPVRQIIFLKSGGYFKSSLTECLLWIRLFSVSILFLKYFHFLAWFLKSVALSLCVLLSVFLPLPVEAFYCDANHLSRSFYYLLLLTAYYGIHITIQENPVNTLFSNYFISHCFIKEFILGRIGTTKKSGGKGTCTRDTSQEMACKAIISVL